MPVLVHTATSAEIDKLAGTAAGLTAAELSILDGVTSTAAELNTLDASVAAVLAVTQQGLIYRATATYSFAVDGGAVSTIPIGSAIPDDAIIVGGFVEVQTTLTSAADTATIALSIVGANDIVSAIAINDGSNPWDAGRKAIIPKFNTPESTSVKLTAANQVDVVIGTQAVTAGIFHVNLFYVMGHA